MPARVPPNVAFDQVPFDCTWRREGRGAASVSVTGEVDLATAPLLDRVLEDALQNARLVVVNLSDISFMDCVGLHVIIDASARARRSGAWLVLAFQSPQVDYLLDLTGARASLDFLPLALPAQASRTEPMRTCHEALAAGDHGGRDAGETERVIRPLNNPVNASVVAARAMGVPDRSLWLQAADGVVLRAWMPKSKDVDVPAGTPIEVYLDDGGEVNGWREPSTGLAINQRHLATVPERPDGVAVACQGPCGVVWRVPTPTQLARHHERCLTCAGPLALP